MARIGDISVAIKVEGSIIRKAYVYLRPGVCQPDADAAAAKFDTVEDAQDWLRTHLGIEAKPHQIHSCPAC